MDLRPDQLALAVEVRRTAAAILRRWSEEPDSDKWFAILEEETDFPFMMFNGFGFTLIYFFALLSEEALTVASDAAGCTRAEVLERLFGPAD